MKKGLKALLCLALCVAVVLPTVGCKKGKLDPETRPLMLATAALDGNFNPFFATSLTDTQIIGMTQAAMLTIDENDKIACGDDYPTVVLDYTEKMFTARTGGTETVKGSKDGRTEYEFLIKKGMKFSDGQTLDINDVLFNLYVYLDPAYTGSATIYSTDIQGLAAYRSQDPSIAIDGEGGDDSGFYADALGRVNALIAWSTTEAQPKEETLTADQKTDLATVKRLFREEATTDWTAVETSWEESFKENYTFTEAWQAYLFNEGIITVQTKLADNGSITAVKDNNGKYVTTLDPDINSNDENKKPIAQHFIDEMNDAVAADKVSAYMTANGCDEAYAKLQLQKAAAIELVVKNYTTERQIASILSYWATGNNALEEFAADARSKFYENQKNDDGSNLVPSIKGITTYRTNAFNGKTLDGTYDVLKITINGIDPKAIYNFAFAVAPMHYYSDAAHTAAADAELESVNNGTLDAAKRCNFGVKIGDKDFFTNVLKDTDKNGLPVGAGPYKASSETGAKENLTKNDFFAKNIVNFERNENFGTMGKNIENAKIKYLKYKVIGDDKIISALKTGEIDYGEPNATPTNLNEVNAEKNLTSATWWTMGYGYVGINPKFVPDVKVRRAIMMAMDTASIINSYYDTSLATTIYRPISTQSWAYPENASKTDEVYSKIAYTTDTNKIIETLGSDYVKGADGIYKHKRTGEKLSYTFTIAGETTDHPAYKMFLKAEEILDSIGFDIEVKPDIQALKKMNSGSLEVWAAAWSSGIDPDMYQVYHKDSKATSVNNWNYSGILNDKDTYEHEYKIVIDLSKKIDEGRETIVQSEREKIYEECLNLIMDLAVELPTYQRKDLAAYNKKVIDSKSVNQTPSSSMGVISEIWKVKYAK